MGLLNFEWVGGQRRPPGATPLLRIVNLSVRLGQRLVLDDVTLDVYEREHVKITGPNGAGKSTLFNAIMGVVPLATGRIEFCGKDLGTLSTHERAELGIRYMKQRDNVFPSLTIRENLRLAIESDGYERFRNSFPDWATDIPPDKRAGMLSGGQKQKLAWAMAILGAYRLFLADEASAGSSSALLPPGNSAACYVEHT